MAHVALQTEAYLLLDLCTESLADRLAASHEVKFGILPPNTEKRKETLSV